MHAPGSCRTTSARSPRTRASFSIVLAIEAVSLALLGAAPTTTRSGVRAGRWRRWLALLLPVASVAAAIALDLSLARAGVEGAGPEEG